MELLIFPWKTCLFLSKISVPLLINELLIKSNRLIDYFQIPNNLGKCICAFGALSTPVYKISKEWFTPREHWDSVVLFCSLSINSSKILVFSQIAWSEPGGGMWVWRWRGQKLMRVLLLPTKIIFEKNMEIKNMKIWKKKKYMKIKNKIGKWCGGQKRRARWRETHNQFYLA